MNQTTSSRYRKWGVNPSQETHRENRPFDGRTGQRDLEDCRSKSQDTHRENRGYTGRRYNQDVPLHHRNSVRKQTSQNTFERGQAGAYTSLHRNNARATHEVGQMSSRDDTQGSRQQKIVHLPNPVSRVVNVPVERVEEVERVVEKEMTVLKKQIVHNEVVQTADCNVEYAVEKSVSKVIRVPKLEVVDRYTYNDVYVDEVIEVEVPVIVEMPNFVEVKVDRIVEKDVLRNIPCYVPACIKEEISTEFRLPLLKPVYEDIEYEVRLPRFTEVPVYREIYENESLAVVQKNLVHLNLANLTTLIKDGVDVSMSEANGGLPGLSGVSQFMDSIGSTLVSHSEYLISDPGDYRLKEAVPAKMDVITVDSSKTKQKSSRSKREKQDKRRQKEDGSSCFPEIPGVKKINTNRETGVDTDLKTDPDESVPASMRFSAPPTPVDLKQAVVDAQAAAPHES